MNQRKFINAKVSILCVMLIYNVKKLRKFVLILAFVDIDQFKILTVMKGCAITYIKFPEISLQRPKWNNI